jgi:hypothetical protein
MGALKMCTSESSQIDLLAEFIRHKTHGKLWVATKAKDWTKMAYYYNGSTYVKDHYDSRLKSAFEK